MDSSTYKEMYRQDMIVWSEAIRNRDPGYFCRLATSEANCPVWLITDARRESDMQFFAEQYGTRVLTVKVLASEEARKERGWIYTKEVDDYPSECGLDHHKCHIDIDNGSPCEQDLLMQLEQVINKVKIM